MAPHEFPNPDPRDPPKIVDDLRPHQRKAFELCAVVLGAFRRCEANPIDEEALNEGLEKARKIAEIELRTQNDKSPASFLADGLGKVVQTVQESAETFPLKGLSPCFR